MAKKTTAGKSSNTARDKSKAIVEAQKKKEKKTKNLIVASIFTAAILILGGIGFVIAQDAKQTKENASVTVGEQLTPDRATAQGAFYVSTEETLMEAPADSTAMRVDTFIDPQCPGCGVVERGIGERLEELVENKEIDLYINPVSFLDKTSADRYSSRAANAVITVAEESPEHLLKFVNAIFAKDFQPAEGGASVPDEKLALAAISVGVPETVANNFKNHSYFDWLAKTTETQQSRTDYFAAGFSTPSVFLNSTMKDGVATGFTKVLFQDEDVLKSFNETYSTIPKGK